VLSDTQSIARKLTHFLGIELNEQAMSSQVDATLYRNRAQ
jgi:ribosome-binding protein aMBF1 (putative translation factor)